MNKRIWIIMALAVLLLSACSASPTSAPVQESAPGLREIGKAADASEGAKVDSQIADNTLPGAVERIVIKNASLSIIVVDPNASMDVIGRMAEEMGGFIVTSDLSKYTTSDGIEVPRATITIRVPAEKLNDAIEQIKAQVENLEDDVRSENVTGQDVTEEYTNLDSRLRNLELAEKQLQKIMDEAVKTEDVLSVFNQLTSVREQIEIIKGQMQYYQEAAALSAVSVELIAKKSIQPIKIGGWQPEGVARDAVQAMIKAMQGIGTVAIWMTVFCLPIGLVIAIPIAIAGYVIRRVRRNRKATTAVRPTQQPPAPPAAV